MEYLSIHSAHNAPEADKMGNSYPKHTKNLSEKYPEKAPGFLCARFKSNVHETTHVDLSWPLALRTSDRNAAHANLNGISLSAKPSYRITVCVMSAVAILKIFNEGGAHLLVHAVEEHTPPFHQYLEENDEPMMSFNMPSIDAIGNGMYRKHARAQKRAKAAVQKGPSHYNFPKTAWWDSIETFHVSYGVPVVRDMQWAKGTHAAVEEHWHRVFIQRLPVLHLEGKHVAPSKDVWARSLTLPTIYINV